METRLVNAHNSKYDQLIDRTTIFGNPFPVEKWGRAGCIKKFEEYFWKRIDRDPDWKQEVLNLKGKVLGCHCAPLPCHGEIYVDFLETYDQVERARVVAALHTLLDDLNHYVTELGWYIPEAEGEAYSRLIDLHHPDTDLIVNAADRMGAEHYDILGAISEYINRSEMGG